MPRSERPLGVSRWRRWQRQAHLSWFGIAGGERLKLGQPLAWYAICRNLAREHGEARLQASPIAHKALAQLLGWNQTEIRSETVFPAAAVPLITKEQPFRSDLFSIELLQRHAR